MALRMPTLGLACLLLTQSHFVIAGNIGSETLNAEQVAAEVMLKEIQNLAVAAPDKGMPNQRINIRWLSVVSQWLSDSYDLPRLSRLPDVEFVSVDRIVELMRLGFEDSSFESSMVNDVAALYLPNKETIYLTEGWTGNSVAEQSVLVHELVHHLQNIGGRVYACPGAREKIAYRAQDDWLAFFGTDFETAFDLDPMMLLILTKCGI